MIKQYTVQELKDFETEISDCFKQKMIRSPIHLYDGNEEQMLTIFKDIGDEDWVFCSWRSHYQCLLKGVPRERLKQDIIDGRSISLCYPEYKIFSSAIVGGIIPIANGVAFDLKQTKSESNVWCFIGDMTSELGCFHENWKYSTYHELPITWIIEDNGKSVCTDTKKVWNSQDRKNLHPAYSVSSQNIRYYTYDNKYPHAGTGERIQF
jgi:TPP-dependent pyruvate/acetoin dehydrogenase alpha subunit